MNNEENVSFGETPQQEKQFVSDWAYPTEFAEGKAIAISSFKRLSKEKGETTATYVDKEGMTYRLTFWDADHDMKLRKLEVSFEEFKRDLAFGIKNEFGVDVVPTGTYVRLKTYKEPKVYASGKTVQIIRWSVTKIINEPKYQPKATS